MHAGLLPEHIRGAAADATGRELEQDRGQEMTVAEAEGVMEKLNADTCAWMLGERAIPEELWQADSPLWTRLYSVPESRDVDGAARMQLEEVNGADSELSSATAGNRQRTAAISDNAFFVLVRRASFRFHVVFWNDGAVGSVLALSPG